MKIALIAGTGGLPPRIANSLLGEGRAPVICEMRGFASEVAGDFVRVPFRIETLGTLLGTLTSLGVEQVCMAGAVSRPDVDPGAIDPVTAPMVPRLMAAMAKGDDGTLREIITIFEEHGFAVVGAHQVAPDLLPQAGVLTKTTPPPMDATLNAARSALADMGQRDLGQALLLRDGVVIAREDTRGTAAMLRDFSGPSDPDDPMGSLFGIVGDVIEGAADWLSAADAVLASQGTGAILYKGPKPQQSLLAGMPLIGPDTATQAAEAGLAGIVIPAGGVMVLDTRQVVAVLDAHNMFLWVHR